MNKLYYYIITYERLSHKKSVNNKSSTAANIYYYTSGDSSLYCSYTKIKIFLNMYGNRTRNETNIMLQLPLEYNGGDNKIYIYDENER